MFSKICDTVNKFHRFYKVLELEITFDLLVVYNYPVRYRRNVSLYLFFCERLHISLTGDTFLGEKILLLHAIKYSKKFCSHCKSQRTLLNLYKFSLSYMIRFSKSEDYVILLLNALTINYKKRLVPLSKVARDYHIPLLFLRNIANVLMRAGFIKAVEGKKGGYQLAKSPKDITLGNVLRSFSHKPLLASCSDDSPACVCGDNSVCSTGTAWRRVNQKFLESVSHISLGEFVHEE